MRLGYELFIYLMNVNIMFYEPKKYNYQNCNIKYYSFIIYLSVVMIPNIY